MQGCFNFRIKNQKKNAVQSEVNALAAYERFSFWYAVPAST
jgi:hypothetical protein